MPLDWARRRQGRLAAFVTGDQAEPEIAVEVTRGQHRLDPRMFATALTQLELAWLATGVSVRIDDGGRCLVVHRKHDPLVSDDGRTVGRFEGLRFVRGESGNDAFYEPGLLEVTFESRPTGPVETAGRPMVLPEVLYVLRRLPTRTDSWCGCSRSWRLRIESRSPRSRM